MGKEHIYYLFTKFIRPPTQTICLGGIYQQQQQNEKLHPHIKLKMCTMYKYKI